MNKNLEFALFIALVRAYDSYITPLNPPYIRCWKSKKSDMGASLEGWFLLGISKQKIPFNMRDPIESQHITFHMPMSYWDKTNAIELPQAPAYNPNFDTIENILNL